MAILLQSTEMGYPFRTKDIQLGVICADMVDFAGLVTVVNNQLTGYGR